MLLAFDAKSSKTLFTKKKQIKKSMHGSRNLILVNTVLRVIMLDVILQLALRLLFFNVMINGFQYIEDCNLFELVYR